MGTVSMESKVETNSKIESKKASKPGVKILKSIVRAILPSKSLRWEIKKANWRFLKNTLEAFGYTVALRKDYYSPLSSVSDLKATLSRWNRPSAMKGVDYNIEKMEARLSILISNYLSEFSALPPFEQVEKAGFGVGFIALDALMQYCMIRYTKPKRYIEVGSGLSTYYCSLAAEKNASEGYPLQIICIEPFPYEKLYTIPGIQIIVKEVQDVELSLFEQLEPNDIFFIDSSHMIKVDSDVPFLYLEVLPILKVGVTIHVHDIPFPYNVPYPAEKWIFDQPWPLLWNEAMILQAFLLFNNRFTIELSTPMIRYFDEPFLKKTIPIYESLIQHPGPFSSIWLKRNS